MLDKKDIKKIAKARLQDAEALFAAGRYDGAIYLGGYAVELGLKARICKTLGWSGYPSTSAEFKDYRSFKTHDLDVLLHLSGSEDKIKTKFLAEWSAVAQWDPDARYQPTGNVGAADARLMLSATAILLKKL
jgi:HEPN domain-containing protein